eukprot:677701-Hanusia_phi.AAC.1
MKEECIACGAILAFVLFSFYVLASRTVRQPGAERSAVVFSASIVQESLGGDPRVLRCVVVAGPLDEKGSGQSTASSNKGSRSRCGRSHLRL